ncbi:MAG: hypothetical protein PHF56_22265 [Desulfuromonadaceae bacterium]|nr:hypothetical protein [Desulfuromonadaceae bacterium]
MINIKRSDFYPVNSLNGKRNYKRFHRIESDGSVVERIFLNVTDSTHREHLIFIHYLKHLSKIFKNEQIGVNVLDRDNPWDFKIEMSTGELFNLEITSIADSSKLFEIQKREEFYVTCCQNPKIRLRDLDKISKLFPNEKLIKSVVCYFESGISKDENVENPLFGENANIFISNMAETIDPLEVQIRAAIESKIAKAHAEKEITVLIIDNRTSAYDMKDYLNACEVLGEYLTNIPFPEVWFYTGYFSDDDGNNSEFSFGPLKVKEHQNRMLEIFINENDVDELGRVFC